MFTYPMGSKRLISNFGRMEFALCIRDRISIASSHDYNQCELQVAMMDDIKNFDFIFEESSSCLGACAKEMLFGSLSVSEIH